MGKMAKNLEDDPFPIYKSCYKRKATEEGTSMQDLMKIFGHCDWYSCPNGHLYTIGECRMAVMMSKCPECGEAIGGRFHRHLDTNLRVGAVRSTYNPIRNGLGNGDEIKFDEVSNVVHTSSNTGFAKRGDQRMGRWGLGHYHSDDPMVSIPESAANGSTISKLEASDWKQILSQFGDLEEAPEYLVCPLSMEVFVDPVVTPNGKIYERQFIENWLKDHDTDPVDSNITLNIKQLETEEDVKKAARLWRESRNGTTENKRVPRLPPSDSMDE